MSPSLTISVIIPVLDEARQIGALLDGLASFDGLLEIIVVDGGSRDDTITRARSRRGVMVLEARRGRARQMNAGAAQAAGEVLLFLHADVRLPRDAAALVRSALVSDETVAGAFRTRTVPDGPTRLGPLLRLADVRSRFSALPYGDQALFVRAAIFEEVGGFPDLPILEDLVLSERLSRRGQIARVPADVRVSGRRFQARPVYYTLLVNLMPTLYRLGVPTRLLASLYGQPR